MTFKVIKTEYSNADCKDIEVRRDDETLKTYCVPQRKLAFVQPGCANYRSPVGEKWHPHEKCNMPWLRNDDKCFRCTLCEVCTSANAAKGRALWIDAIYQSRQHKKSKKSYGDLTPLAKYIVDCE